MAATTPSPSSADPQAAEADASGSLFDQALERYRAGAAPEELIEL